MDSKTSKRIKFPKDETFLGEQETEDTFTYTASFWVWIRLLRAENLLGKDSLYSDQENNETLYWRCWIWILDLDLERFRKVEEVAADGG